ncbi:MULTISPECIES: acyl carrier protein [Streptomyces]|uniref:acyl carrier protein n=1 Tax=Streptomyces TaxID=1883 RepID=UPI000C278B33|nr:acyl carrier protein [Streptomyces sp. CB01201]MBX7469561.1 acyl carrier protein [Streptomyces sp. MAG02]PJM99931.1 actinorhodin polyketide synthase [Streptomyces sp. CB01201]
MSAFTVEDLFRIMRECAGEEEAADLSSAAAEQEFALLGYDSLALMEAISRVERGYGVELPEELLGEALTPAAFVDAVNAVLAGHPAPLEAAG